VVYAPSTQPTAIITSLGSDTICAGQSVSLSLQGGSLGDNAQWYWYTEGCALGSPIDSGNSILVIPVDTVTPYFVASVGGCNTVCRGVTIVWRENCTALPLHILDFDARLYQQNKGLITWQAIDEEPGTVYVLEKSVDGKVFNLLSKQDASGVHDKADYSFIDHNLVTGKNYYRLKSTEPDGQISYTNIKEVNYMIGSNYVRLYPNPTSINMVSLEFTAQASDKVGYWITDIAGRNVQVLKTMQPEEGKNTISVSLSGLAQGSYLFHYQNSNGMATHIKFVKVE
jgi:hypothetical protein